MVQKGDTLLYLENLDNWCKVMTADGYTGYIQTEDISEPEAIEARTAKKDSYERITRDHKINLVWHQSTSTESNDAMAEMTAEMTGVNVISPTWFSVTDETGTISSLASASYVKLAHEAGREVWGLIVTLMKHLTKQPILPTHPCAAESLSSCSPRQHRAAWTASTWISRI